MFCSYKLWQNYKQTSQNYVHHVHFCASLKQLFLDYQKELKRRSINFQSWLLVFYVIATVLCLVLGNNIALSITTNPEDSSCFTPVPKTEIHAAYIVVII